MVKTEFLTNYTVFVSLAHIFYFVHECDLYGYADDNTLSKAAKDAASLKRALERDTANMLSWFTENYMSANPDKFQAIVLGMKNPETMNFAVGNVTINPSQSVKLLGIEIDSKLNFDTHVHEICQKAARQINALKRLSKFLNLEWQSSGHSLLPMLATVVSSGMHAVPKILRSSKNFSYERYVLSTMIILVPMTNY